MPQTRSYLKVLAGLLPAGAMGISSALASTADRPHHDAAAGAADPAAIAGLGGTAAQLKAIRQAVSSLAEQQGLAHQQPGAEQDKEAWWYFRNYWPNFRNYWPNWGNYWRNW